MTKKKLCKASLLLSLSLFALTSCNTEQMADDTSKTINSGVENMLPNIYVALAQLGAFLVTVLIFTFFFYKPLKKKMDQRKNYVSNNVKESEKNKQESIEAKEIAENNIRVSKVKANQIIEDAQKQATIEADKIKEQAQNEIDLKQKQADKDIEEKKALLERQNHNKIVETALDASKEILGRELTQSDNDKIVSDFISQMNKDEEDKQ